MRTGRGSLSPREARKSELLRQTSSRIAECARGQRHGHVTVHRLAPWTESRRTDPKHQPEAPCADSFPRPRTHCRASILISSSTMRHYPLTSLTPAGHAGPFPPRLRSSGSRTTTSTTSTTTTTAAVTSSSTGL
ncbi:unnamed protein product [Symbiodinium necroappetens]|uniref:Uncharacterized protein n=1 Tax=Symbiodinium necroappetens TaxID=1628268 RepID=A0A812KJE8_9DINO|nr:unnamed protein product [Symbiodinium necroappetens]